MRLGGRLQATIEILQSIENHHRPVASALKDWGSSHRFAGSGDRSAIGNIVYDALRMKLSHAYMMDDDSPFAVAHAVLFRQWGDTPAELLEQFDGDKFAPEIISDAALATFAAQDITKAEEHVQADIPEWLVAEFKLAFGDQWLDEAVAMTARAPVDLRTNTLKVSRDKALDALSRTGAEATELAPFGMRVAPSVGAQRSPNVVSDIPFAKGWFEVQDEGSQLASAMTLVKDTDQVLDYCAGGGGKTLALSAAMVNTGQIHAYDSDTRRMAPMIERLRRAGTRNVQLCETPEMLDQLIEHCDNVLVDAPCSGTGTWRRRPDTKWRLSERSLDQRIEQQKEVIEGGSQYVKKGGCLTYVTCSVLPQENDQIVSAFLSENPEFSLVDLSNDWCRITGQETAPKSHEDFGLLCSPKRTETDGFYISRLKRNS
jgi:16S rRNA (cytosine967-C5)-methyltransferase